MKTNVVMKRAAGAVIVISTIILIYSCFVLKQLSDSGLVFTEKSFAESRVFISELYNREWTFDNLLLSAATENNGQITLNQERLTDLKNEVLFEDSNIAVRLSVNRKILLDTTVKEEQYSRVFTQNYNYLFGSYEPISNYVIDAVIYVKSNPTAGGWVYEVKQKCEKYSEFGENIFLLAGITGIPFLISFVYLVFSSGHRKGQEGIRLTGIDKIPFEVFTLIMGCLGVILLFFLLGTLSDRFLFDYENFIVEKTILSIPFAMIALLGLVYLFSFIRRVKAKVLLKNTLIYRISWFWFIRINELWSKRSLIVRPILIALMIISCHFVFLLIAIVNGSFISFFLFFGQVMLSIAVFVLLLYWLVRFKQITACCEQIGQGNLKEKVNMNGMPGILKEHALTVNKIGEVLQIAVNNQLKSERMKTELITNVSHDIKTPLTSIINYVDLLKKEELNNDRAGEYLEVLERQSMRLKKLVIDLVDVSKATTGNMPVNMVKLQVAELLTQVLAEYEDKFAGCELTTIVRSDEELSILADGNLLWRVFDNLLSNICKYSMPCTRVYIDVNADHDNNVSITLKNISKEELNIPSEELIERFVRGDSARNTEGSGLGLSIAETLTSLQKGNMSISIEGDLFKVTLSFARVN